MTGWKPGPPQGIWPLFGPIGWFAALTMIVSLDRPFAEPDWLSLIASLPSTGGSRVSHECTIAP